MATEKDKIKLGLKKVGYDKNTDTLYISFGSMKNSVSREHGNGILVQYNTELNIPVGLIIHDFEERFSKNKKEVKLPELPISLEAITV